jgi:hypothetical protein
VTWTDPGGLSKAHSRRDWQVSWLLFTWAGKAGETWKDVVSSRWICLGNSGHVREQEWHRGKPPSSDWAAARKQGR